VGGRKIFFAAAEIKSKSQQFCKGPLFVSEAEIFHQNPFRKPGWEEPSGEGNKFCIRANLVAEFR